MARREHSGRPPLLTDDMEAKICAYIRAGAFAWVAAQAAGIGPSTFHHWMADDRPQFIKFRKSVDEARAQARLSAEAEVKRMKPEVWLRLGPGRDKPGEPGWTESSKVELSGEGGGPVAIFQIVRQVKK